MAQTKKSAPTKSKTKATQDDAVQVTAKLEKAHADIEKVRAEIRRVIFGQQEVVDLALTALIANGHALIVGVPGLAKTLLVETLGTVLGLDNKRIQCTPDLMPADIIGSEVLEEGDKGKRSFRFIEGPVFTNLLMADEINRASPRTQSALLQAMQEKSVTANGVTYTLPEPFHVLATQNPLEQEGTYPLPEAQLDRFLLQIDVAYPDEKSEREMLLKTTSGAHYSVNKIIGMARLQDIQDAARDLPVGDKLTNTLLSLVRSLRPQEGASDIVNEYVAWAPGPRAAQALMQTMKAYALLQGRASPSLSDLKTLAVPVLQHRMALSPYAASDNVTLETLLDHVL